MSVILLKIIFKDLKDMILLYMIIWTLYKRFTSSSVRMSNVSNTNYIKAC